MTYHFLAIMPVRPRAEALAPGPVEQIGDEGPESIEEREIDRGDGAGSDDDDRRARDLFPRGPLHLAELVRHLVRPGPHIRLAVRPDDQQERDERARDGAVVGPLLVRDGS